MLGIGPIDAYRDRLAPAQRETVDRLRTLAAAAGPDLVERIKWNAPSFAHDDVDRITLGIQRNGDIRVVLHRGARSKPIEGFAFEAPADLVAWPAPDRGVLFFSSAEEVDKRADEVSGLFRRWLEIK
jgi:hypothetical protein